MLNQGTFDMCLYVKLLIIIVKNILFIKIYCQYLFTYFRVM